MYTCTQGSILCSCYLHTLICIYTCTCVQLAPPNRSIALLQHIAVTKTVAMQDGVLHNIMSLFSIVV